MPGGAAVSIPFGARSPFSIFLQETYQGLPPLEAIRARAGKSQVIYRTGRYISEAVDAARKSDVAIVFATQWQTEGFDVPDLSLPNGQDALIAAVAKANPHTIVVLQTGSAVMMPWLEDTAAVLEAWYPGAQGGQVIASVLFGDTNPSGRLPITFPASLDQLPRPRLDGSDTLEPDPHVSNKGAPLAINYDIEGADVGYRWFARKNRKALFPFGYGLSYTNFSYTEPRFTPDGVRVTVTNTGARAGSDVVQLYLTARPGGPARRLVGFGKVTLRPGESRSIRVPIERRVLADWANGRWRLAGGTYRLALARDAETSLAEGSVKILPANWQ
jgi:beta-glucosidase